MTGQQPGSTVCISLVVLLVSIDQKRTVLPLEKVDIHLIPARLPASL